MKKILAVLSLTAMAFGSSVSLAQDTMPAPSFGAGLKEMANAVTSGTNWTAIAGYGHSINGGNNVAFCDVAYNFTENVGVVVGYDYLWSKTDSQFNAIKGGVSLQTSIRPFAFLGSTFLTNVVAQPFAADLIATPKSGNAIGNIVTTGVNFDIYSFKNFELTTGFQYEKRMGQGSFDGNYGLFHLGISRRF